VARRSGGDEIATWHDSNAAAAPATDRLLGVFTGHTDRDYRNMGLLWDVLQALSGASGSTDLATKVVERLATVLRPVRASFFIAGDAGANLIVGRRRHGDADAGVLQAADLVDDERAVVTAALDAGAVRQRPLQLTMPDGARRAHVAFAVPLVIGGRALGAICLVGNPDVFELDRTDLHVLTGLAGQLAVALDREQLAERQRVHVEHERRRLQAEVHELRTQKHPIVFQSPVMADLLARARRVAATDATVLVTGESGTGKEMLAQSVHHLSGRRARPFVIVDCGAIPATLIDSELFGHERGAFTGAQQRASGRLAMADGGTVFLDEIGELPLDVQSRLLRFVQEKTISAVGGTRARKVDVRIIAATNRRLEEEVRAGRFREDLFYRLNVVRLHVPPLRERPEDIRLLAEHFASAAAADHGKPLRGFTAEAERRLTSHDWPGNIRELQNTILQAVVLAEGDRLGEPDLKLAGGPGRQMAAQPSSLAVDSDLARSTAGAVGFREAWDQLRLALEREVQGAASANPRLPLPIGRWLAHEVVLVAHEQAGRNGARAAARVGLPQTTFARRLRNAQTDRALGTRPPTWVAVTTALALVIGAADLPSEGFADRTDALLFDAVRAYAPTPIGYAAALMGLSPPTLKQRLVAREASYATTPG
jgi:transcriptional regulator with GAF, ATPase, and Fis domain